MKKDDQYDYGRFIKRLGSANKEGKFFEEAFMGEDRTRGEAPVFSYPIQRPEGWKESWDVLVSWTRFWKDAPKAKDGHLLYQLRWANAVCGSFGKQRLPTHADVMYPSDALSLLGLEREEAVYRSQHETILKTMPALSPWHTRYFQRIQKESFYPKCLSIAGAFLEGKGERRYKREITAAGVDTKFIERHAFLIRTLWNHLFKEQAVPGIEALAAALSWKEETTANVYVRFLDETHTFYGARHCFLSAEEMAQFQPPADRVFITENKVNGYTFPPVAQSLILAGTGYGILDAARESSWLREKKVYYWGDLDSDGFYILSKLREMLPHVRSFLMDESTAMAYETLAVEDTGAQEAIPQLLTVSEKQAWKWMRDRHLRIEQERIAPGDVEKAVRKLLEEET